MIECLILLARSVLSASQGTLLNPPTSQPVSDLQLIEEETEGQRGSSGWYVEELGLTPCSFSPTAGPSPPCSLSSALEEEEELLLGCWRGSPASRPHKQGSGMEDRGVLPVAGPFTPLSRAGGMGDSRASQRPGASPGPALSANSKCTCFLPVAGGEGGGYGDSPGWERWIWVSSCDKRECVPVPRVL